jgi:excisionase family DNA binding protein
MSSLAAGLAELVSKLEAMADRPGAPEAAQAATERVKGVLGPQWINHDAFTVEEAGTILGLSRASAFAAVSRGDIPSIRVGKRLIIPRRALERMLEGAAHA